MTIQDLLSYSDDSREVLRGILTAVPQDIFVRELPSLGTWNSPKKLLAHIAGAEQRWVCRIVGWPQPETRYEQIAPDTADAIYADWDALRAETRSVVAELDADGLARPIQVSLPQLGFDRSLTVEQILFHAFNHQVFHLGQISMALQQFEIDPPMFDYILFLKD